MKKTFSFSDFNLELQVLIRAGETALDKDKGYKLEAVMEGKTVNWERVYELARIHQIRPLLLRGVSHLTGVDIPATVMQKLKYECTMIAASNLRNTHEMLRLLVLFKENGITAVPYKGAYLANTYYGDFGLREFGDIDLFVHLEDIPRIKELMLREGYKAEWDLTPNQEKMFFEVNCEYNFQYFDSIGNCLFHVEPHYRSNHKYQCINLKLEDFTPYIKEQTINTKNIAALSPETHLILTFTNHGVNEGWTSLKYIFDLFQMINKEKNRLDWDFVKGYLDKLNLVTSFNVGLFILNNLFGINVKNVINSEDESLIEKLTKERMAKLSNYEKINFTSQIQKFNFNLRSRTGIFQKIKMIIYQVTSPTVHDLEFIVLPNYLAFLYIFVRPLRVFKERVLLK